MLVESFVQCLSLLLDCSLLRAGLISDPGSQAPGCVVQCLEQGEPSADASGEDDGWGEGMLGLRAGLMGLS